MHASAIIDHHEVPIGPEIPSHAKIEKAVPASRDDREKERNGIEPAMAVMPGADLQRMPELASPGRLPVDPMETPARAAAVDETDAENRARPRPAPKKESAERALMPHHSALPSRQCDAGETALVDSGEPTSAADAGRAAQGLASLFLPASRAHVSPGKWEAGQISIELHPRIAATILEALGIAPDEEPSGPLWLAIGPKPHGSDRSGADNPIDLGFPGRSPHGRGTTRRTPDRVAARPDPAQWRGDELLTLTEAASLFWPDGPLTTTSLRTAARDGTLEIRSVAGRHMTTPAALRRLGLPKPEGAATGPSIAEAAASMLGRLERRR